MVGKFTWTTDKCTKKDKSHLNKVFGYECSAGKTIQGELILEYTDLPTGMYAGVAGPNPKIIFGRAELF